MNAAIFKLEWLSLYIAWRWVLQAVEGYFLFLFVNKKTEVGWRRHLSVGGGSQKGGSGNRPSQENKGYNYQLRVVHERS